MIKWTPLEQVEDRILFWKDIYEESKGWVEGKLEFLMRIRATGEIRLFKPSPPDHRFLGIFQNIDFAQEWAEERLAKEKGAPEWAMSPF
jgi:hypothetical protein